MKYVFKLVVFSYTCSLKSTCITYLYLCANVYACVLLPDVESGFGLLPSGTQRNVVIGDTVHIECRANKIVFSRPLLFRVDGTVEIELESGSGLKVTHSR